MRRYIVAAFFLALKIIFDSKLDILSNHNIFNASSSTVVKKLRCHKLHCIQSNATVISKN